ncbi:oligosaccharide flippase family protein [Providencia stuartii]|uniref:oligosaccharide flippase family protein n=1 Tax=Providencia stuartii TaxID=588 RepID=UPI0024AC50C6|nr:oligosaccharide flippase family protein [Providencia stuartii]MCR4081616.1 oligosaccharide flippase family protein [Providencia stuartii]MDX7494645.1 oligosaccharide flippase family protein [Providencia stuartii]
MVNLNIIANLIGKLIIAGAAFLAVPIYVNILGKESYSLVSLLTTIQAIFILLDGGISAGYLRQIAFYSKSSENNEKAFCLSKIIEILFWCISAIIFFLLFFSRNSFLNGWLDVSEKLKPYALESFGYIAAIVSIKFILLFYYSTLKGYQRFLQINIIITSITIAKFIFSIILLQFFKDVSTIFKVYLAMSIFELIMVKYYAQKNFKFKKFNLRVSIDELKKIKGFIGIMALVSLTSAILSQMDKIIISSYVTLEEYSYYAIASLIASVPLLISSPMSSAIYPKLVQLSEDTAKLTKFYIRYSSLISIIIFPLSVYYVLNANEILIWWTSDKEITKNAYLVSILLILGSSILSIMSMPYFLALANMFVKIPLVTNLITISVTIPMIILLAPKVGIISGGISWLTVNIMLLVIFQFMLGKKNLLTNNSYWFISNLVLLVTSFTLIFILNNIFKETLLFSNVIFRGVFLVLLVYCLGIYSWRKNVTFHSNPYKREK